MVSFSDMRRVLPFFVIAVVFYTFLSWIQPTPSDLLYKEDICTCGRWHNASYTNFTSPGPEFQLSTCSMDATLRGPNQSIVSFSFYGSVGHSRQYFQGIETNAELVSRLYPGWTMRLYHEVNDVNNTKHLCRLQCAYRHVLDVCYVGNVPGYGNLLGSQQNMWRFLPLADPLVDVVLSRDLDSCVSEREAAAVQEWLLSRRPLHVMRDHPFHKVPMLAGMWGARLADYRGMWRSALDRMLQGGQRAGNKGLDQALLAKEVWSLGLEAGVMLQHDSYFCNTQEYRRGEVRPFPTRRLNASLNFVGSRRKIDVNPMTKPCPKECRKEPQWTTC